MPYTHTQIREMLERSPQGKLGMMEIGKPDYRFMLNAAGIVKQLLEEIDDLKECMDEITHPL